MKSKESLFAVLVALAVVLAGVAPAVASDEVDSLSISVDQSGESPVVTVTHNASGVANASVSVTATNNSSYAGEGDFTTDANGTVSLPAPAEDVTVEVAATKGNASASTTVELLAAEEEIDALAIAVDQSGEQPVVTVTHNASGVANASVSVTATDNGSYAGEGDYLTDANGTLSLPAPAENVTVEIAATKGNASASTTVELLAAEEGDEEPEFENFGERVSWFVHSLLGGENEGGIGGLVSDFVTSNNPGADNRPDHAGPGGDRGPDGDRDAENETAEGTDHDGPDDHPGKSGAGNGDNADGNGNGHDDQDDDDHPDGGPPPWAGASDD